MSLRYSIIFFAQVLLTGSAFAQSDEAALQQIDMFLKTEFDDNKPGASVLISRGDQVIYENAFGLASVENRIAIKSDMIFQIASMTKQFTAIAILKLVENGKLLLQDTLQNYIEYFPHKSHAVTIEHLLTHTSGIPEFFDIDEDERHLLVRQHTTQELISYFKNEPLEFKPGSKFRYSNSNYVLLGAIIEKVTDLTYDKYMHEFVFKPLGMSNTSVWYHDKISRDRIPAGYMIIDGKYVPSVPITGSILYASGGIVSTVDDLYTWNRALKKNKIISAESLSKAFKINVLADGTNSQYGYGFFIKELQGERTIQHGGNLYGFTSSGLWLVDEDLFVGILSNRGFARTEDIADYIASILIGKPIEISTGKNKKSISLTDYTGAYRLDAKKSKQINIIVVSDRLVLTFPDQPGNEVDVMPAGRDDTFESKKIKAFINFVRDQSGNIVAMEVEQGKKYKWIKIN